MIPSLPWFLSLLVCAAVMGLAIRYCADPGAIDRAYPRFGDPPGDAP